MSKTRKIKGAWDGDPSTVTINGNQFEYEAIGLVAGMASPNYHLTERGMPIVGKLAEGDLMLVLRRKPDEDRTRCKRCHAVLIGFALPDLCDDCEIA